MAHHYIAIDPGGTSGMAYWKDTFDGPFLSELPPLDTMKRIEQVSEYDDVTFVVERFVITPATAKNSPQYDALEIIGVAKYFAAMNYHTLVLQTPAEAIKFSTDTKLKKIGWYDLTLGKQFEGHARMACRHLMLHLAKSGKLDLAQMIGG